MLMRFATPIKCESSGVIPAQCLPPRRRGAGIQSWTTAFEGVTVNGFRDAILLSEQGSGLCRAGVWRAKNRASAPGGTSVYLRQSGQSSRG